MKILYKDHQIIHKFNVQSAKENFPIKHLKGIFLSVKL
jgi:hypothetical protein